MLEKRIKLFMLTPPKLSDLPYGTKLKAGLGESTVVADFDFETYSTAGFIWDDIVKKWQCPLGASKKGLGVVGTVNYTEHPDAEVLCLAYDLKDGKGRRLWTPVDAILKSQGKPHNENNTMPFDLIFHIRYGGLLEAWNISFEYWVWTNICIPRYGFPPLQIKNLRCAQAKARAFSLPGSLAEAGVALDIIKQKDKRGKTLITKFCIPRNPTKNNFQLRNTVADEDGQELYDYCLRDIEAEAEISSLVPDLSEAELEFWQCDQAINRRGVQVDMEAVNAAIKIVEQTYKKYNAELSDLTNGEVTSASQLPKLKKWLNEKIKSYGEIVYTKKLQYPLTSLTDSIVLELMQSRILTNDVERVLEIRQLLNSAAIKKLYALKNQTSSHGRVHNLFVYHSARTGRAAGAGPQPQNFPNSGPFVNKCESCGHYDNGEDSCPWCGCDAAFSEREEWSATSANDAIEVIKTGSLSALEYYFGNPLETISGCLRGMFIAKPDHVLVCSDYSAIEAVVLAELAGETWRQEVFRTHGKIYEMSASKITGIPFQEYLDHKERTGTHHPTRKTIGKVAELASGYGGWIGAWKQFGADEFFTEDEMKSAILAWRKASPAIVEFWGGQERNWQPEFFGIEGAAIQAVLNPGVKFSYREISYVLCRDILYCILPSGRPIAYHTPRLEPSERRPGTYSLTFRGWNTNPKNGKTGWIKIYTYGGRLVENIVQAVARDILAYAIVNLEHQDFPVVLHVHDEIVAEVHGVRALMPCLAISRFEEIMSTMPSWAKDWPVKASGGWVAKRYSK